MSGSTLRDDVGVEVGRRTAVAGATVALLVSLGGYGLLFPGSLGGTLARSLFATGTVTSALRLSVPIALAALGGIFAEKSGVINIGLEGLLIISAFTAVYAMDLSGSLAVAFLAAVLASTVLAGLFAVVCIEFRADQIIAGLAVWLIALGLAPFASQVIYEAPNTDSVRTVPTVPELVGALPSAGDLPARIDPPTLGVGVLDAVLAVVVGLLGRVVLFVAEVLLASSLSVYLMVLAVVLSWYVLYRTRFGRWVHASGENPKALDTAGVRVDRVRYAAVLLSGVLSGLGGAALSLGLGQFTGNGATMVNGKGFIAIVAYLFGNYNPVGAFLSTLLFAGLQAVQNPLQLADIGVPDPLIRITPFVMVIVVLALVGRTRIPASAGEHYESGEE
jgi:simple sugar transport system permease protein